MVMLQLSAQGRITNWKLIFSLKLGSYLHPKQNSCYSRAGKNSSGGIFVPSCSCMCCTIFLLAASWYRTDTMAPAVAGGGSSDPSQLIRRGHCTTAGVMPQLTSDPLQLVWQYTIYLFAVIAEARQSACWGSMRTSASKSSIRRFVITEKVRNHGEGPY